VLDASLRVIPQLVGNGAEHIIDSPNAHILVRAPEGFYSARMLRCHQYRNSLYIGTDETLDHAFKHGTTQNLNTRQRLRKQSFQVGLRGSRAENLLLCPNYYNGP